MAEFRLGRIRFVWKDVWAPSTVYYVDDVVRYGGKVYICQVGHTSDSTDFYEDLGVSPSRWNLMSDGQTWRDDWDVDTFYSEGDIVLYGGITYICNTPHTSNSDSALSLEADQEKWDTFAESLIWRGSWSVNTQYKKNEVVSYGGITYICRDTHQSALTDISGSDGLAEDSGKWEVINPGLIYRQDWSSATTKYRINDVVKYGAGLWICTTNHVPTTTFADDIANWSQFVEGFEFEDDWSDATVYQPGDIVRYGGNQYIAKTNASNKNPLTETSDWDLFSEGLRFESDWSIQTSYKIGSIIRLNGYSYLATTDSPSIGTFANATDSSTNRITVTDTTGMVVGMAIQFTGISFGDINPTATYYVKTIVDGTTIAVTDDADLSNDITVTTDTGGMTVYAAAHPTNTNYFQRLVSGISWQGEWTDDRDYEVGDAVRYSSNAYICIKKHRSEQDDGSTISAEGGGAANSRPDQDTSGVYWNVIAIGNETAVLTTTGDLVYYGGSGPTRLPVGVEGQVLRVSDQSIPEWVSLGATDNVYYVASTGVDLPAPIHGITRDKPFKTIRYACEQIEKGTKFPNARTLLELNRVFIQREVTEWIQNNISVSTLAGDGSIWDGFDYEDYKCERDIGFVIDALIYDMVHGGNVKTRGAANSLVGGIVEDTPGAYPNLSGETQQSLAAYSYMLTLIGNVLSQEAPSENYQTTNGDNSTKIVDQYFDANIDAETTALPRIQTLTTIITNAISDGDTSRIPARNFDEAVVMVATGTYREVLPIIVPEGVCILGDELRSTNIGPGTGTTHKTDAKYSLGALGRLETVLSDVITGTEVTPTSGNVEVQSREWPYGEAEETTAASKLVRAIQQNIDFRIGSTHLINSTDPIGYNSAYLSGYGDARKLVKENKEFLKEEVIAYIADNYPNLKYSRTKCRQDVGYIVDAIVYDLTYGGYSQSLNAGLAYYDGYAGARAISASEISATVAAYTFLKSRLQSVVTATLLPSPLQTDVPQFIDTAGSGASVTFVNGAIDIIKNIVQNGTDSWPSVIITTIASNVITTSTNHNLQVGDLIVVRSTANGFIKNTRYWVVSTPTNDTLTVSESFGGSAVTLSNGTSLSIEANKVDYPAATNGVSSTTALITAAETLSAAKETIINNVIDDLNEVAYHTDFLVSETNLTNDDFEIYVGKSATALTYVSGGTITKSDDSSLNITNFVYNESTGIATVTSSGNHGLEAGDIVDITNITVSYIGYDGETKQTTYPYSTSLTGNNALTLYIQNKCIRDIGLILEAVIFDTMLDSNFQSIKAGYSYLRSTAKDVYTLSQKTITRNALTNAKTEAKANVGGDATAQARIETLMTAIDDIIYTGSLEGDNCVTSRRNREYAILQIERNRDFLVSEIDNWISNTYTASVTVTQDSTDYINVSDTSWMTRNTAIVFSGATTGGIVAGTVYYVQNVIDNETITIAETRNAAQPLDIADDESQANFSVSLYYNSALCLRDVNAYLDAIKYDLKYSDNFLLENVGNYKSMYAARYYANAVLGSLEEDCFYLRNATGVRNCTLEGLTGDLLPENEYGTSRVSAGAYCSLDPGWGPADYRTWIIARSPYVQGVTTFGTAAIGQKIDGALHDGGNDSIVSNDFTQVISDGIGAWITNNGRAELVSVFSYYAHIGYLAENGGRIRGTNGNCSYGDFGAVAEGFDAEEVPNTAVVDNKSGFTAVIGSVNTNNDQILNFEFDHAGNDFTEVEYVITGGGVNSNIEANEFRDDSVFQVRLLDLGDDSSGQLGGDGYLTNANTAQAGTTSSITLAAVDQEVSSAYVGMKVVIDGGAGQGQFGIVSSYNSGTKVANVIRESDGQSGWDHFVPGTTIVSPNASSTYVMEPAISFTSPGFTAEASTLPSTDFWTDVEYGDTCASYLGITPSDYTGVGVDATFDVVRNGSKYIVTLASAGTNYERLETFNLAGESLGGLATTNDITITITAVNSVTGAILEFDLEGVGSGGVFVAVRQSSAVGAYSRNGETWLSTGSLGTSQNWGGVAHGILDDGSSLQKKSIFVAVGGSPSNDGAYSYDGVNWVANELPESASWSKVAFGNGRFVAISTGGKVAVSLDGEVWDGSADIGANVYDIAYGIGKFVVVPQGGDTVYYSEDGLTWSNDTLPASSSFGWKGVTFGNGKFVAVDDNSNNGAYSLDGINWSAMTIGSPDGSTVGNWQNVSYGQGLFMATTYNAGAQDFGFVATSENGIYWEIKGLPEAGSGAGYKAVAFGNPQREGKWVVIDNNSSNNVLHIRTGATTRARAFVAQTKIFAIRLTEPGSGYDTAPTMTVTDPNNTFELPTEVRIGKGALATPNFINRGTEFTSANAEVDEDNSNGVADFYQSGGFVFVRRLSQRPVPGSNVVFGHLPNRTFKLVNVLTFLGQNDGAYTAFFQVSPELTTQEAPENETSVTTRIRFSQCRLTGHDFLDVGTGSFEETNYPGQPTQDPIPANETQEGNGGRVFYTSTDQDGNFRVGDLFTIEQSTGVATLNADAFNISGLQELSLGEVTLGGGSAAISEFSTDPFFTADSDTIVPTQRAIRAFIASQIGGGGASLNVNSVTAGSVFINTNQIRTVDGSVINMRGNFNFKGPVAGYPIAWNYFLV